MVVADSLSLVEVVESLATEFQNDSDEKRLGMQNLSRVDSMSLLAVTNWPDVAVGAIVTLGFCFVFWCITKYGF